MIKVESIFVGNEEEAFVEENLEKGLNVIFSDDNNRGKTIVVQTLMFAMGSDPFFPSSFGYRDYYCGVELCVDGNPFKMLRKKDSFILLSNEGLRPFDNASELKRYWSDNVTTLPEIIKEGRQHTVPLSLFNQMFFAAQDGRSSSRTMGDQYYNKVDFTEMLYALRGIGEDVLSVEEKEALKAKEKELKKQKTALLKQAKLLESQSDAIAVVSPTADRIAIEASVKELDDVKSAITDLKNQRNRALTRQKKNESVLTELRSLNRTINVGELVCLECGSDRIGYRMTSSDATFDITTAETRRQILSSVEEKVVAYSEEAERLNYEIREKQKKLDTLMVESDISLIDIMVYQDDYKEVKDIDYEIVGLDKELGEVKGKLNIAQNNESSTKEARESFMADLLERMGVAHRKISGDQSESYPSLFTTKSSGLSGSETTEYFNSRAFVLADLMKHGYPIVVDSFRAEDLSTAREHAVLDLFRKLDNQVILTTTIKNEEHDKYAAHADIVTIDYSGHPEKKLLSKDYHPAFVKKLEAFGIAL